MRNFVLRLALNAVALLVIAALVPGITVGPVAAVVAAWCWVPSTRWCGPCWSC